MLNVGKIEEGIVLDHIEAGKAMLIYHYLHLDREDFQVAIIKNARSNDMGRKDILKVECNPDLINLDAVAFIDPEITVNVIKGGEIIRKVPEEDLLRTLREELLTMAKDRNS